MVLYEHLREIVKVFSRFYSRTMNFFTNKQCPTCGGENVQRTKMKGFFETKIYPLMGLGVFRCYTCRGRFYFFNFKHQSEVERKKSIRRRKKKQQKEDFPQFYNKSEAKKEFEKMIVEIRESEKNVAEEVEKDEVDPSADRMIN